MSKSDGHIGCTGSCDIESLISKVKAAGVGSPGESDFVPGPWLWRTCLSFKMFQSFCTSIQLKVGIVMEPQLELAQVDYDQIYDARMLRGSQSFMERLGVKKSFNIMEGFCMLAFEVQYGKYCFL